jgi:hypothetical protein
MLIFALIIGLSIALVWSSAFDTHGPWDSFFWFFLVIFLFSWGGGSWVTPFGPTGWGVSWLPFLCMGIFMALLLTAATPQTRRRRRRGEVHVVSTADIKDRALEMKNVEATFDVFFWMLLIVLAAFVVTSYFWHLRPV